jgi:acetyl-CoA C-acetyltransferase
VSIHGFADDELIRPGSTVDALGRLDVLGASIDRPEWLTEHIEHRHTVGSAPGMADAASLVVLSAAPSWEERRPRARLVSSATVSVDAVEMLSGNVQACGRALERAGVLPAQVDVWEVNESFAVVPVHFARSLEIDASRLNPNGGAIAMGHPLGATGGVLTATLLDELDARGGRYGVVSICGGAGVATALVFERLDDTV